MVNVKFFGINGISTRTEAFDAIGMEELLDKITYKYKHISLDTLRDCIVLMNGRCIAAENYNSLSFKAGDEVHFLVPIVGG